MPETKERRVFLKKGLKITFFSNEGRIYRGSCFVQLTITGVQNAIRLTEPLLV